MANVIKSTWGTTEAFVTSALMGLGATQQDPNGRFYLDGNMVNVELSNIVAEAIYIEGIFRNNQSVTDKYTTDRQAGTVRVMLDTAFDSTSRTLSYGGRPGTPGNSGIIDTAPPLMPTNDEILIYLNQVNTQAMIFADLAKEMVPIDVMASKIAGYARSVTQDRSASTLAEIIAYNVFRALNGADNIESVADIGAENAYARLINTLNGKLDDGDYISGAYTYPTAGRTIIGRAPFINNMFNRNSGIILNGSDLAQEMLRSYDLDVNMSARNYVGTGYKGYTMQFHMQSAPSWIWTLAERYLNLPKGSLDNLYAVATSYQANAVGTVTDLGVKLIDANEVRGIKAQPLNRWGHESFRKSQLIGDSTFTVDYLSSLGFTAENRIYPVAPKKANRQDKIVLPIYGLDGSIVGYKEIAEGMSPNGDNWQSGIKSVNMPVATPPSQTFTGASLSVTLSSATPDAKIYYTTDGTTPTANSTEYTTAISVTATTTIKAIAVKDGMINSNVMTEVYTKGTASK